MQSLNNNFNLHRLERYLALSWQSGAIPVIILTKRDLVEDYESYVNQVESIAIGVDIYGVSCKTKEGISKTFQDVENFLGKCKFSDCTHTTEPGCKILEAIENGELSQERFERYLKLQKESRYNTNSEQYLNEKKEKFKEISKINKHNKNR